MSHSTGSAIAELYVRNDNTQQAGPDLHDWPFYWLVQAHGRYQFVLEEALKAISLDVPRWRVLMLLEEETAQSVSYLANESIAKLSTMTRIVQRMERDGLVRTRHSAVDARVTEVLLTERGVHARKQAWKCAGSIYDRAFDDVPAEKIKQMNGHLKQLCDNLSRRR